MDALAQLALMTKAKLIFETEGTFLSFPALSPLSYTPDQLNFAQPAPNLNVLSEFSRLANALPGGALFQASLDTMLWDIYHDVLQTAQLASSTLTPDQQSSYQQAEALLWTPGPDGLPTPSSQAIAYSQYEQAYDSASQAYRAAQLTAAASTDPSVQAQWQSTGQPQFAAQVQAAEDAWIASGFKAQIEQARGIELSCISQSPALQWQTWQAGCINDIDLMTDTNDQTFGPTTYSPFDILTQQDWPVFSISHTEIAQLVSQAPTELANALDAGSGPSNVQSLSFEFCSVTLGRAWFNPAVFAARYWRFPDPAKLLSDGNTPAQGQWPAYVTGLVFARNIVATEQSVTGPVARPVPSFPPVRVIGPIVRPPIVGRFPILSRPIIGIRAEPLVRAMDVNASPAGTPAAAGPPAAPVLMRPILMSRLGAFSFAALPQRRTPAPATSTAPATPSSPPVSAAGANGSVSILAFICKSLPKCPNPDPSLNWTTATLPAASAARGAPS
jgi:hypothetical protein